MVVAGGDAQTALMAPGAKFGYLRTPIHQTLVDDGAGEIERLSREPWSWTPPAVGDS